MMPLLKYLLSTMPHSFNLTLYHSSLHRFLGLQPQQHRAPSRLFSPPLFSLTPDCPPSLSASSTPPSSVSPPAALRTGPTPSVSARAAAHRGQPSEGGAAARAAGWPDAEWSGLLWWGQGGPVDRRNQSGLLLKCSFIFVKFFFPTYRASSPPFSHALLVHWPSSLVPRLVPCLFRRRESHVVSHAAC